MRLVVPSVLLVLALAACGPTTNITSSGAKTTGTQAKGKVGTLTGSVKAPPGFTPPDSKTAKFGLLSVDEQALAGVEVYLAFKSGERVKGPVAGRTDVKGEFVITSVPYDLNFLVMTDTKDPEQHHAELCAMTRTLAEGNRIEITYASSIVTLGAIQGVFGNILGSFDFTIYTKAVAAVAARLDPKNLPNLNDPKAIQAIIASTTIDGVPLTTAIADIQQTINNNGVSPETAQALINGLGINFSGSGQVDVNGQTVASGTTNGTVTVDPTPTPTPTATPTPTPAPTATPTATPTPTPTPH
jgi:hypothetical protein